MPSDVFNFVHVFILNYKINVNASQSEKHTLCIQMSQKGLRISDC